MRLAARPVAVDREADLTAELVTPEMAGGDALAIAQGPDLAAFARGAVPNRDVNRPRLPSQ